MRIKTSARIAPDEVKVIFDNKKKTSLIEEGGVTTLRIHVDDGVAKSKHFMRRTARLAVRNAIRTAQSHDLSRIALSCTSVPFGTEVFEREELCEMVVTEAVIAAYNFSRYKTNQKKKSETTLSLCDITITKEKEAVARGEIIGTYVNHARDMANIPGGDMTPSLLAEKASKLSKGTSVNVTILNKKQITAHKMGALLGVSKGSVEEPRFIIMEYWGGGKKEKPLVFVGKGITFDTGGLNLKPSDAVLDMHLDMSGGAAVIAAVIASARMKLKKNIIGLIPAAENMVSGNSYRPGDVLTTMSGKTVEVLNTDAEGRLVLADALTYAKKYNPRLVLDIATLTGASLGALGQHASAYMTSDDTLRNELLEHGEKSGDYLWPLPLWEEYIGHTKGNFADLANIPTAHARYGGAINGGAFLSHFTESYLWAHIDMAPRMVSAHGDHLAKGATGEPTRLLLSIAKSY